MLDAAGVHAVDGADEPDGDAAGETVESVDLAVVLLIVDEERAAEYEDTLAALVQGHHDVQDRRGRGEGHEEGQGRYHVHCGIRGKSFFIGSV